MAGGSWATVVPTLGDASDNVRKESHSALIKVRACPTRGKLTKAFKARGAGKPLPQRYDFIDIKLLVTNVQESVDIRAPRRTAGCVRVSFKKSL